MTGTYTYNGLTISDTTTVACIGQEGLDELPDIRSNDIPFADRDGLIPGMDFLGGRTVTLDLAVTGSSGTPVPALLDQVKVAFAPVRSGSLPLTFQWPGISQRLVYCRSRKFSSGLVGDLTAGVALPVVQLFAADPRIYDATLTTTSLATSVTITNAGNFESRPVITVTPASSPVTITNAGDSSRFIKLATSTVGAIPNPCVIDLQARTVVDGSGVNRFDVVDPTTQWFVLVPGANALTISGGSASVAWRSAWL